MPSPVAAPAPGTSPSPTAEAVPTPVPAPPVAPSGTGSPTGNSGATAAQTAPGETGPGPGTGGPPSALPPGGLPGAGTSTAPAQPPAATPQRRAAPSGPAVYYVAIDDGGSSGVRFGCNDSLVAVRSGTATDDPLTTALGRLLDPANTTAQESGLYNALSGSALHFVSGYFSGTTVVVDLSGSLRPGGVCDNPRIEAQLTQTIVAATGASRAEIYIDGRTLAEVLSLR
ncbi:GerMN domain-containing protein [Arthrobacter cavernae]|uniref:GerMN domain-containing protein n=1 Tax=Arthrobacter cavernae TaxID=2817681 RepID=UPI001F616BDD|nr:GerMN domain-containing protein [Arthrobacter cavernae]